jgi:hypothetical protein
MLVGPADATLPKTEPDLSDWYWRNLTRSGPFGFEYASIEEITADSHLIVRGKIVSTATGGIEPFDDEFYMESPPVTFAVVAIDEVLKGSPESKDAGTVLVARLAMAGLEDSALPKDEVILFLKNCAQMRADFGMPPATDKDDRYFYTRPNAYQAVLRNRGGLAWVVPPPDGWAEEYSPFPGSLSGADFAGIGPTVRHLADEQRYAAD